MKLSFPERDEEAPETSELFISFIKEAPSVSPCFCDDGVIIPVSADAAAERPDTFAPVMAYPPFL